jgi:hypothetical protein
MHPGGAPALIVRRAGGAGGKLVLIVALSNEMRKVMV